MVGAGVIADALAVVEGYRAKQAGDQLTKDSQAGGKTFDPSVQSTGKTANVAAIALAIGGTAVAITGAIILITSGGSARPEAETKTARLSLSPWLGPGLVGGGARLCF
jgi:hypothetical protein